MHWLAELYSQYKHLDTRKVEPAIEFILPFYGKWPVYMPLFLHSVKHNPMMVVHLITDIPKPDGLPENVHYHFLPLADLEKLVKEKTGYQFNIQGNLRKLCDLKPLLGHVFEDYLLGHVFWAWGDMDILFGRLHRFIKSYDLANYDVIAFRDDYINGCFTVMKNSDYCKKLYALSADVQKVADSDKYMSLDEFGGLAEQYRAGVPPTLAKKEGSIQSMTYVIYNEVEKGNLKITTKEGLREVILPKEKYYYFDGCIFATDKEVMLYHYVTEKRSPAFSFPNWQKVPERFYIAPTGFYKEDEMSSYAITSYSRQLGAKVQIFTQRVKDSLTHRLGLKKN